MCAELSTVVTGLGVICRSACGTEQLAALAAATPAEPERGDSWFDAGRTSGMVAGLEAVMVGAQALRRGRARLVVAGATEGPAPAEIADFLGGRIEDGGACALTLETARDAERRGAKVLGGYVGGALAFFDPACLGTENGRASLATVVADALNRTGISGGGTLHLHMLACEHRLNRAVTDIVSCAFEDRGIDLIRDLVPG